MNAAIRFLRQIIPSAALSLVLGFGSWQVATAQGPPDEHAFGPNEGPAAEAPIDPEGAGPIDPVVEGPDVEAARPGPALLHHFVHIEQFPGYEEEMVEVRTELLLFEDNSFNLVYPAPGEGCEGEDEAPGPTTIVGAWGLEDDQLSLTFEDGFVDYALMTGPGLDFHDSRWSDLLAPPADEGLEGPVEADEFAPIGPQ